ncbi:MAG: hypothetical protein QOF01_5144 [Thermomicrobiales bacterium]|jgi:hypothetical protein|nr:hypothetical protein [Thermomicrobiales bacterium]
MTVKERIHLLVEELDEQQAEAALVLLDRFLTTETGHGGVAEAEGPSRSNPPGHLLTSESPLWGIVGLVADGGPIDTSENVDKYAGRRIR